MSAKLPLINWCETEYLSNRVTQCKRVKGEFISSTIKFYELCERCLASHCVTELNCNKVEMAQAKTGGLSCV